MTTPPQRRAVEVTYRGDRYQGEWFVRDGRVHVLGYHGSASAPAAAPGMLISMPSSIAEGLLWQILREADPDRPFFYWP